VKDKDRGSVYIFVISLCFSLMIMTMTFFNISLKQRETAINSMKKLGLYELALSEILLIVNELNVSVGIKRDDINNLVYMKKCSNDIYDGEFVIVINKDSINDIINSLNKTSYTKDIGGEIIHFVLDVEDYDLHEDNFLINLSANDSNGYAVNLFGEVHYTDRASIVNESYEWLDEQNAAFIGLSSSDYTLLKSIKIEKGFSNIVVNGDKVDISAFYKEGEPVHSIIISDGDVTLTTSNHYKNVFKGTIIANGNVYSVKNIEVNGQVLAHDVDKMIKIIDNMNAIFNIEMPSKLKRMIYDAMGITNFINKANSSVNYNIEEILNLVRLREGVLEIDTNLFSLKTVLQVENK
jgi:hypothetical protein